MLQNLDDLVVVPVILIEYFTVDQMLQILNLMDKTPILKNCMKGLWFDADFEQVFSIIEFLHLNMFYLWNLLEYDLKLLDRP